MVGSLQIIVVSGDDGFLLGTGIVVLQEVVRHGKSALLHVVRWLFWQLVRRRGERHSRTAHCRHVLLTVVWVTGKGQFRRPSVIRTYVSRGYEGALAARLLHPGYFWVL